MYSTILLASISDFDFNRVGNNGGFVNSKMYIIEDEATAN